MVEKAVKVVISGRVQGVSYRAWTMDAARALGLNGWVRNRKDGTVEALFAGSNESVEEMVARCHLGPSSAIVESVKVTDAIGITDAGFKTLPTV